MKKILATAAVLAFAGSAFAGSFAVNGSADFGAGAVEGGLGSALTWDGAAVYEPSNGVLQPNLFSFGLIHTGVYLATPDGSTFGDATGISTSLAPGGNISANLFNHAWFNGNGTPIQSGMITVGGSEYPAVMLGYFADSVSNLRLADEGGSAAVQINDVNEFVNFDGPNGNGYQLVTVANGEYGGNNLYVALIPTPGAAGLLGLAGLAAVRRRR